MSRASVIVLCAFTMFAGLISHDAGRADSNATVKLVVILASGWTSSTGTWAHTWSDVKPALAKVSNQLVVEPYSYQWPGDYTSSDTQQSVAISASSLNAPATKLLETYPSARLMIVGHSEGGVVATYWLAQTLAGKLASPQSARLRNAVVVTMDSPVKGLDWGITQPIGVATAALGLSAIPSEFQPGSSIVTAIASTASASNYYNIASTQDQQMPRLAVTHAPRRPTVLSCTTSRARLLGSCSSRRRR